MGDPFSVASSTVGVISLGLTVTQGLLQYYGAWKDYTQDLTITHATVEELSKTFMSIKTTVDNLPFHSELLKRVEESLELCKNGMGMLEKKYTKIRGVAVPTGIREKIQKHIHRALYPFKEKTLAKLREIVAELRDNLSLSIGILHLNVSGTLLGQLISLRKESITISTNVAKIQHTISSLHDDIVEDRASQINRKILAWIESVTPLDFRSKQQDVFVRHQSDTGQWFLDSNEFLDWSKGSREVLLCSGIPGTGKTVLSSVVIEWLGAKYYECEEVGIAYVYCSYNEQASQRPKDLIASIWRQLNRAPFSSAVRDLYTKHWVQKTTPSSQDILNTLRVTTSQLSRTFIVIDGLDECSEENASRAALLSDISSLLPNVSVMITSRTFANVIFPRATYLDVRASDEDVRKYINARISQEPRLQ